MINLIKSSFFNEKEAKELLCSFIKGADILSMSAECKKFEVDFSKKQGRKFGVFVNSGSSANLILIQSFLNLGKLRKGDVVGVSALTWATNIMPLFQLGLVPFLIDCEINTLNVSPDTFLRAIGMEPRIRAFFLTNTLGFSDDIKRIKDICVEKNILFFEDNCESLGSEFDGILLGNFGIASTFSFFVGHHLSTIEGGMVCTDDENLYKELVMCRAHGWDRNLSAKDQHSLREKNGANSFFSKYTFYDLAYNVRPTEVSGFLGNTQLKYWDEIVEKRSANFKFIHEYIYKNKNLIPIEFGKMSKVSNFAVPIIAKSPELAEKYKELFCKNEVEIRPIIAGSMALQPFFKKYSKNTRPQANADHVHKHGFYFGNNPELTKGELDLLASLVSWEP